MTPEIPSWEKEEAERWSSAEIEPPQEIVERGPSGEEIREAVQYERQARSVFLLVQWLTLGVVNVVAFLNLFEIIPSIYPYYPIGGFDFAMRCLFSDLVAHSERKHRNQPIVWWLISYFFPAATLLYLFFFPYDDETPKRWQLLLDAGFGAACILSWFI